MLWFDVGIKRYTTTRRIAKSSRKLWFDVGIKRYTTTVDAAVKDLLLWFDVGIKRYTTNGYSIAACYSCGLM